MTNIVQIIKGGESALISMIMKYADERGYSSFTPNDPAVWKISIRGLSGGLVSALEASSEIPELSLDLDFMNDRITAFGIDQARRHSQRGVTLVMFLGLMKYFRQSYHDLLDSVQLVPESQKWAYTYIERYFDRIELGFISEWERAANELNSHHEKLLLTRNTDLLRMNAKLEQEVAERKRAEQQIKKLNMDLERRVTTRTLQLQRINEQNNYKLKELLLLNRFSSLNLSNIRLNRLTHIILTALTSNAPLFFDRAMLFLMNEKTQVLQGMLGLARKSPSDNNSSERDYRENWDLSKEDMASEAESELSREIRSCRIELKKGKGIFSRTVYEKKVISLKVQPEMKQEAPEFFNSLNIDSMVVMPLIGKNGVFGVVLVDNPLSSREISREDLKFLQLFSNHAGIAIKNLMLYSTLEDTIHQLHEAQEQLVHRERLATIGEMAASIAHELKGPMVAIGGFARRLARKIPPHTPEAGYVATIIEEENRLENMLTEVLSFSKKTTICYESCSIIEVVESALLISAHALNRNRVTLQKSFPKKVSTLYGDCQQLKQVFINLFQNAIDVMRDGGVLTVAITSSRFDKGKAVAIRISDTGGGIPQSLRNNIFNPFFTTKKSGTGLGLPIANRIVSNHHGKIRVRNSEGGAEFTVFLPSHD
jgi:signal transduction histidine kinase